MKFTGTPGGNEVYFRLYSRPKTGLITVVCMQWFDEYDYFQDRFVRNANGDPYYFAEENEAISQMRDWYPDEEIDPEYRLGHISNNLIR